MGIPDFARGPASYTITSENASNVVTMTTSIISNMQPGAQIVITNANPFNLQRHLHDFVHQQQFHTLSTLRRAPEPIRRRPEQRIIRVLNDTNKGIQSRSTTPTP